MGETRMDPRIRRTKEAISDAFLELLTSKNFNDISVSDITTKAQIARPTFYLHYKTKQNLLSEYLDVIFESYLKDIQPVLEQHDQHVLSIALFNQVKRNAPYLRSLMSGDASVIIQNKLHQYIREVFGMLLHVQLGEQSKLVAKDTQKFIIAAVAGSAYALTQEWLKEDMRHDPEYMGKLLFTISRPGIIALLQKGI
jgi:AcrR family transcriptional regulator